MAKLTLEAIGERALSRVYSDFIMPSRLDEYREFLQVALDCGYESHSVGSFTRTARSGGLDSGRHLVLQHDVDTDPGTAEQLFAIEQSLGVRSSFFFRLSTVSLPLMQRMDESGFEVSYHYEEIATFAKQKGLVHPDQIRENMAEIQSRFVENLTSLRRKTGLSMTILAAHGDFANRYLGVPNWVILDDLTLRNQLGIELEVYDKEHLDRLSGRYSDDAYPKYWKPEEPQTVLRQGVSPVHVLTHPRHWRRNLKENLRDDFQRAWQGALWQWLTIRSRARRQPDADEHDSARTAATQK